MLFSSCLPPKAMPNGVVFATNSLVAENLLDPYIRRLATLAQLVEQLICNQQVVGSIPVGGSCKNAPRGVFFTRACRLRKGAAMRHLSATCWLDSSCLFGPTSYLAQSKCYSPSRLYWNVSQACLRGEDAVEAKRPAIQDAIRDEVHTPSLIQFCSTQSGYLLMPNPLA